MKNDSSELGEHAGVTALLDGPHDAVRWRCETDVAKLTIPAWMHDRKRRSLDDELRDLAGAYRFAHAAGEQRIGGKTIGEREFEALIGVGAEPELLHVDGNLLMYGGASCQWQTLIGNGTATAGQALTYFNNAQAAVGVGDTSTAAAATQTDLLGTTYTTNKLRVAMDATFPTHTDGVVVGAATAVYRGTFGTSQANFAWQEWAIFNSSTAATGRMLNRKVESLGTKTSAASWQLTLTLTLA